ncbi:pseudouridine synthase [Rhizoclosmatium globosum]|uniref:Pseudouridine synthase n=1 Tax=Rhizoclosmatium globosum TaxID=329046 RepID=A0A1Y2CRI2_9FUNG|nr:pseudouridine synthase [Rhizoclosmatium globosum]|eukprot:ORY49567.1 pseudouridine synthase [Rhizoclosmatium globosum]
MKREHEEEEEVDAANKAPRTEADATTEDQAQAADQAQVAAAVKPKKAPKQRMAILFGYCGTGYKGSQLNPGQPTIERDLMDAFAKSGAITEENNDPKKVGLNRCARTDKGVHAAGNVVSLKLFALENLVEKVNACLPPQIRIYDAFQVNSSFNAKNHCGGRQYEYSLPTYMLRPAPHQLYPHSALSDLVHPELDREEESAVGEPWTVIDSYEDVCKYRLDPDSLAHLRACLKEYEGTHNFHNFTVGVRFNEKNAGRYMKSFIACDPYVRADGVEWISLRVNGQSFMLHQIRKMVGLVVMMVRTKTPATLVAKAYKEDRINIPKAPALGLLLRKPTFDSFNKQIKNQHEDSRKLIEFDNYADLVNPFVEEWVNKDMYKEESEKHVYMNWLLHVDERSLNFSWWLTKEGTIQLSLKPTDEALLKEEDDVGGGGDRHREED